MKFIIYVLTIILYFNCLFARFNHKLSLKKKVHVCPRTVKMREISERNLIKCK